MVRVDDEKLKPCSLVISSALLVTDTVLFVFFWRFIPSEMVPVISLIRKAISIIPITVTAKIIYLVASFRFLGFFGVGFGCVFFAGV